MIRPLASLVRGADGIYGGIDHPIGDQSEEMRLREEIAARRYDNYMAEIAKHHSVCVMDKEIRRFIAQIPRGGTIVDVGGCWGWHWRGLPETRPDLKVVIVDFVRANLLHAQRVLGAQIDQTIFLVEGDATRLDFPEDCFDGYWSVQTLQHIPRFEDAIAEAARVLKPGGHFACYWLNDAPLIAGLTRALGRNWHVRGQMPGAFWLERLGRTQIEAVRRHFGPNVVERFSEILFTPDLRLPLGGGQASRLGRLDALLSGNWGWQRLVARQHSLHATLQG